MGGKFSYFHTQGLTSTGCVSEISVLSGYSSGSNVAAGRGSAITYTWRDSRHERKQNMKSRRANECMKKLTKHDALNITPSLCDALRMINYYNTMHVGRAERVNTRHRRDDDSIRTPRLFRRADGHCPLFPRCSYMAAELLFTVQFVAFILHRHNKETGPVRQKPSFSPPPS